MLHFDDDDTYHTYLWRAFKGRTFIDYLPGNGNGNGKRGRTEESLRNEDV